MTTETKNGKTETPSQAIALPDLEIQEVELKLVGTAPLIMHKWSEKAIKEMLDKQMKKAKQAKTAKDPRQDYIESMYWLSDIPKKPTDKDIAEAQYGFPAVAFKNAAVSACSQISGLTKVFTRGAFHVNMGEELVEIVGSPQMREDTVRIGMGTADIRYRGEFPDWSTTIRVQYNSSAISIEQIANLFNTAGFSIGVGEWRPEKDGSYGMFKVA